ncbi:hypothetical protein CAEBREN_18380 [Caenorhabditis brenneri]|uniref:VPS37 C-terminal domain-containing protein n=1 Tax=Caenorhabditis brenneri TaxID=135651 RepID=G0PLM4_CAEBE|nr:hypothetical protein CAEBREN_18380 [Caenorhabditis brenneri]
MAGGEPMVDSKTAALEMEIPCQYGDADVKFDFWTNSLTVDVRYCLAKQGHNFDSCQLLQRVSNPLNFSIPTTVDELRVRIEVTNIDGDSIALIDNLHYNGQICELIDEATEHSLVSFNGDSSSVPSLITGEPSTDPTVQKFFEEDSTTSEDTETTSTFGLEVASMPTDKESAIAANKSLAEWNLAQKPRIDAAKAQSIDLYEKVKKLQEEVTVLKSQLDSISSSKSLDTTSSLMQVAAQEADDDAEALFTQFENGEIPIDLFLKQFKEKKAIAHLRKIKSDRLAALLREQTPYSYAQPTAAPRLAQPGYPTANHMPGISNIPFGSGYSGYPNISQPSAGRHPFF